MEPEACVPWATIIFSMSRQVACVYSHLLIHFHPWKRTSIILSWLLFVWNGKNRCLPSLMESVGFIFLLFFFFSSDCRYMCSPVMYILFMKMHKLLVFNSHAWQIWAWSRCKCYKKNQATGGQADKPNVDFILVCTCFGGHGIEVECKEKS